MSILTNLQGAYKDIETMRTRHLSETYQDANSALAHDGEAWREVWPGKHIQILYDAGQFYMGYTLANSPWKMLPHSFDSTCISTTYPGGW